MKLFKCLLDLEYGIIKRFERIDFRGIIEFRICEALLVALLNSLLESSLQRC